jgi:hypothetical protein
LGFALRHDDQNQDQQQPAEASRPRLSLVRYSTPKVSRQDDDAGIHLLTYRSVLIGLTLLIGAAIWSERSAWFRNDSAEMRQLWPKLESRRIANYQLTLELASASDWLVAYRDYCQSRGWDRKSCEQKVSAFRASFLKELADKRNQPPNHAEKLRLRLVKQGVLKDYKRQSIQSLLAARFGSRNLTLKQVLGMALGKQAVDEKRFQWHGNVLIYRGQNRVNYQWFFHHNQGIASAFAAPSRSYQNQWIPWNEPAKRLYRMQTGKVFKPKLLRMAP